MDSSIGLTIGTFIGIVMMQQSIFAAMIGAILAFLVGVVFVFVGKTKSND